MLVPLRDSFEEVTRNEMIQEIKKSFVRKLNERTISPQFPAALGHDPAGPPEAVVCEDRSLVWKMTGLEKIVTLKNSYQ
jgi:hypothetical protein